MTPPPRMRELPPVYDVGVYTGELVSTHAIPYKSSEYKRVDPVERTTETFEFGDWVIQPILDGYRVLWDGYRREFVHAHGRVKPIQGFLDWLPVDCVLDGVLFYEADDAVHDTRTHYHCIKYAIEKIFGYRLEYGNVLDTCARSSYRTNSFDMTRKATSDDWNALSFRAFDVVHCQTATPVATLSFIARQQILKALIAARSVSAIKKHGDTFTDLPIMQLPCYHVSRDSIQDVAGRFADRGARGVVLKRLVSSSVSLYAKDIESWIAMYFFRDIIGELKQYKGVFVPAHDPKFVYDINYYRTRLWSVLPWDRLVVIRVFVNKWNNARTPDHIIRLVHPIDNEFSSNRVSETDMDKLKPLYRHYSQSHVAAGDDDEDAPMPERKYVTGAAAAASIRSRPSSERVAKRARDEQEIVIQRLAEISHQERLSIPPQYRMYPDVVHSVLDYLDPDGLATAASINRMWSRDSSQRLELRGLAALRFNHKFESRQQLVDLAASQTILERTDRLPATTRLLVPRVETSVPVTLDDMRNISNTFTNASSMDIMVDIKQTQQTLDDFTAGYSDRIFNDRLTKLTLRFDCLPSHDGKLRMRRDTIVGVMNKWIGAISASENLIDVSIHIGPNAGIESNAYSTKWFTDNFNSSSITTLLIDDKSTRGHQVNFNFIARFPELEHIKYVSLSHTPDIALLNFLTTIPHNRDIAKADPLVVFPHASKLISIDIPTFVPTGEHVGLFQLPDIRMLNCHSIDGLANLPEACIMLSLHPLTSLVVAEVTAATPIDRCVNLEKLVMNAKVNHVHEDGMLRPALNLIPILAPLRKLTRLTLSTGIEVVNFQFLLGLPAIHHAGDTPLSQRLQHLDCCMMGNLTDADLISMPMLETLKITVLTPGNIEPDVRDMITPARATFRRVLFPMVSQSEIVDSEYGIDLYISKWAQHATSPDGNEAGDVVSPITRRNKKRQSDDLEPSITVEKAPIRSVDRLYDDVMRSIGDMMDASSLGAAASVNKDWHHSLKKRPIGDKNPATLRIDVTNQAQYKRMLAWRESDQPSTVRAYVNYISISANQRAWIFVALADMVQIGVQFPNITRIDMRVDLRQQADVVLVLPKKLKRMIIRFDAGFAWLTRNATNFEMARKWIQSINESNVRDVEIEMGQFCNKSHPEDVNGDDQVYDDDGDTVFGVTSSLASDTIERLQISHPQEISHQVDFDFIQRCPNLNTIQYSNIHNTRAINFFTTDRYESCKVKTLRMINFNPTDANVGLFQLKQLRTLWCQSLDYICVDGMRTFDRVMVTTPILPITELEVAFVERDGFAISRCTDLETLYIQRMKSDITLCAILAPLSRLTHLSLYDEVKLSGLAFLIESGASDRLKVLSFWLSTELTPDALPAMSNLNSLTIKFAARGLISNGVENSLTYGHADFLRDAFPLLRTTVFVQPDQPATAPMGLDGNEIDDDDMVDDDDDDDTTLLGEPPSRASHAFHSSSTPKFTLEFEDDEPAASSSPPVTEVFASNEDELNEYATTSLGCHVTKLKVYRDQVDYYETDDEDDDVATSPRNLIRSREEDAFPVTPGMMELITNKFANLNTLVCRIDISECIHHMPANLRCLALEMRQPKPAVSPELTVYNIGVIMQKIHSLKKLTTLKLRFVDMMPFDATANGQSCVMLALSNHTSLTSLHFETPHIAYHRNWRKGAMSLFKSMPQLQHLSYPHRDYALRELLESPAHCIRGLRSLCLLKSLDVTDKSINLSKMHRLTALECYNIHNGVYLGDATRLTSLRINRWHIPEVRSTTPQPVYRSACPDYTPKIPKPPKLTGFGSLVECASLTSLTIDCYEGDGTTLDEAIIAPLVNLVKLDIYAPYIGKQQTYRDKPDALQFLHNKRFVARVEELKLRCGLSNLMHMNSAPDMVVFTNANVVSFVDVFYESFEEVHKRFKWPSARIATVSRTPREHYLRNPARLHTHDYSKTWQDKEVRPSAY